MRFAAFFYSLAIAIVAGLFAAGVILPAPEMVYPFASRVLMGVIAIVLGFALVSVFIGALGLHRPVLRVKSDMGKPPD